MPFLRRLIRDIPPRFTEYFCHIRSHYQQAHCQQCFPRSCRSFAAQQPPEPGEARDGIERHRRRDGQQCPRIRFNPAKISTGVAHWLLQALRGRGVLKVDFSKPRPAHGIRFNHRSAARSGAGGQPATANPMAGKKRKIRLCGHSTLNSQPANLPVAASLCQRLDQTAGGELLSSRG